MVGSCSRFAQIDEETILIASTVRYQGEKKLLGVCMCVIVNWKLKHLIHLFYFALFAGSYSLLMVLSIALQYIHKVLQKCFLRYSTNKLNFRLHFKALTILYFNFLYSSK